MSQLDTRRSGSPWRGVRWALFATVGAAITLVASANGRHFPVAVLFVGATMSLAGFQLRVALQDNLAVLRRATRLRWVAAALLTTGAAAVGLGLALLRLRGAAL